MAEMQNYDSQVSDPSSRKMETFSYLPEMTPDQIRKQVEWIVQNGWNPGIEHIEPKFAKSNYWYMWKLPMFGEDNVDNILNEAKKAHEAYPEHHVKVIGYDPYKQSQGTAFVVYRGPMK